MRPTNDGLEIVIPAKRNFMLILFLTAWLVGWAMGETFAIRQLFEDVRPGASVFYLVWLAAWTIAGGWAIYTGLWLMFGRELITLTPDTLAVKRDVLGFGRNRKFDLVQVRNLRIGDDVSDPFGSDGVRFGGTGGGVIAFDYGAETFRFGTSVDEAEAAEIVAELESRHSFAKPV